MKILVTGSEGFIGKNLISHLERQGKYKVQSLDLKNYFSKNNPKWGLDLVRILDTLKPDFVFHVGACSNTLEIDVNHVMQLNFESTKILTDWCKYNLCNIVYSSSAANYGESGHFPSNLYGWSKYVAESYVVSNGGIGLRYFNVYGPGENHKEKMASFIFQSYSKEKSGIKIRIFPGFPKRDFVYIDDIVHSNLFAFENFDSLKGNWYDVGSGETSTFEKVLELLGVGSFEYTEISEIPEGYQFLTESSKFMPGWSPKYNLETGIKDYVKRLENGKDFSNGIVGISG